MNRLLSTFRKLQARTNQMVRARWGAVSITGHRENNEDRFLIDDDGRFFIVADGMGGQSAGEKASELATELVPKQLKQSIDFERDSAKRVVQGLDEAVRHANFEIMALGELEPDFRNMGTTIAFVVSVAGTLYIGGVGDSRVYLLRSSKLKQLTTDHSLTQALVDAGTIPAAEAATHRYKNVLYRYLGTKEGGSGTEPCQISPKTGDRYLLCSDGVTDGLEDKEIQKLLGDDSAPQDLAEKIVAAAQTGGSRDNITCVVVEIE